MEQIYERLCWLYATFRSTFLFDAIGNPYPLSDITQLTRAKIPYSERFDEMIDYKQNEVIQDLQMKNLLCTREDWISRGRLDHTIRDDRDDEGQDLFIRRCFLSWTRRYRKEDNDPCEKISIYLLAPRNMIIWKLVSNAFKGIAPPRRSTLSWLHELNEVKWPSRTRFPSTDLQSQEA